MDSELKQGITPSNKSILMMLGTMTLFLVFIIITLTALKAYNNNNESNGTNITPTPNLAQCEFNGTKYDSGQIFSRGDSCNNCTCDNGEVSCEERACEKEFSEDLLYYNHAGTLEYKFQLNGTIPNKASVMNRNSAVKDTELIIEDEEISLFIKSSRADMNSYTDSQFELTTLKPEWSQEEIYRVFIDQETKYMLEQNHLQSENSSYLYIGNYENISNCFDFNDGSVACYSYWIDIPIPTINIPTQIEVICTVKEKSLVSKCDNILLNLNFSIIEKYS